jgi:hypothetical protein
VSRKDGEENILGPHTGNPYARILSRDNVLTESAGDNTMLALRYYLEKENDDTNCQNAGRIVFATQR